MTHLLVEERQEKQTTTNTHIPQLRHADVMLDKISRISHPPLMDAEARCYSLSISAQYTPTAVHVNSFVIDDVKTSLKKEQRQGLYVICLS